VREPCLLTDSFRLLARFIVDLLRWWVNRRLRAGWT
jgi:hypothetical protein